MTEPMHVRARKRAGALVVDNFFKGASRLGRALPAARPEAHGVEVLRDLPYVDGGTAEQRLDVYRPVRPPPELLDGRGRLPVMLYVHGGGFRMLSKESHWLPALIFARRGYVVFNVSYRLAPRHPFPAAIEDVIGAWDWALRNAERFGGDPSRAGIAGESAGGNLTAALTVGTTFRLDDPLAKRAFDIGVVPRASLPAMGLLQVSDPHRFTRNRPLPAWLLDRITEVTEAYLPDDRPHPLADPLLVLEEDTTPDRPLPPIHAACGTVDPLIADTRRLEAALIRRGAVHQVSYWPGGIHAFHMFVFQRAARECWREIVGFTHTHVAGVDLPLRPLRGGRPVP